MSTRSQRHLRETRGVDSGGVGPIGTPAPSALSPATASIAAAGAVGRTIATMTPTGGTAPYTYALTVAAGLSAAFVGNVLQTTVNPAGTAGAKATTVKVTDAWGRSYSATLTVTLT